MDEIKIKNEIERIAEELLDLKMLLKDYTSFNSEGFVINDDI
jgi:hypothetical protein